MSFTPKEWKNDKTGGTKLNAAGLIDLEQRVTAYASPLLEPYNVVASSGASKTLAAYTSSIFNDITLTAAEVEIKPPTTPPEGSFGVTVFADLTQDGTGGRKVVFGGTVRFPGKVDVSLLLTTTPSARSRVAWTWQPRLAVWDVELIADNIGTSGASVSVPQIVAEAIETEKKRAEAVEKTLEESTGHRTLAVVSTDQALTANSTTLQNVTGLVLPIGSSSTEMWRATIWLRLNAENEAMDFNLKWTGVPAGCTIEWGFHAGVTSTIRGWGASTTANAPQILKTQAQELEGGTPVGTTGVLLTALIFGGGTAGNVQFQAAQKTANEKLLTVKKGSHLDALRLAT